MTQQDRDEIRALVLSFSTRISDLPEVVALADGDYITVVQNDGSKKHSKKATLQSLLELIKVYYPDHNGAKYQGIAHPSDANVILPIGTDGFWFAIDAGIYTNYGGITVGNSPKVIKYNATTGEWTSDDLWGDINGTIAFRLKEGHTADSLDTYRIPVIPNRDYVINADCLPAGSLGSVVVTEFNYGGTLIKRTELESVPLNFIPQSGTDYIQVTLGYNHSNPIAIERSEVTLTSSLRTLVEGLYNFLVDVLQGEYEARFDSLEGDISSLFSGLSGLSDAMNQGFGGLGSDIQAIIRRLTDDEGNIAELILTSTLFQTRLSDAEGNISTLRQTADEISAQVENAQGDIARLQIRADEISTEVRNAEGDISRLSQRADQIEATVTNQQGDISRITQRADLIETSVSDIEGRTSTLEQTAEHIQTTVVGIQGEMSQITQRADSIESTVAGLEGDMSRITQRADSIESAVVNLEGDVSQITQRADSIESTVSAIDGRTSTLEQRADGFDLTVTGLNEDIAELELTAQGLSVDVQNANRDIANLDVRADEISASVQDANQNIASLEIRADGIESQVSAVDGRVSTVEQTANGLTVTVSALDGRVSIVEQTADGLVSTVSTLDGRVSTVEQTADGLVSTVSNLNGQVSTISQEVDRIDLAVQAVSGDLSDYEEFVDGALQDIQQQIDGAIDTWFYDYAPVHTDEHGVPDSQVPLTNVSPYADWLAQEQALGKPEQVRDEHVSDIFYDTASGYAYRFIGTGDAGSRVYTWVPIEDSAVIRALEDAARAQDTADNKRRVFLVQPTPPYDAGDLWVKERTVNGVTTREIYRCIVSRASGTFVASDWGPADDYATTVSKANIEILADAIAGTVSTYQYDSEGKLTSETKNLIKQTANDTVLTITGTELETVGIYIHNASQSDNHIDLIADKVRIKGTGDHTPTGLSIVWDSTDQRYKIDAASLNVTGIFSTSAWSTQLTNINNTAQGYANTAQSNAEGYADGVGTAANSYADQAASDAETAAKAYADNVGSASVTSAENYFNNIVYGEGGSAQQPTSGSILYTINNLGIDLSNLDDQINDTGGLADQIQTATQGLTDLGYLAEALLNGETVVAGGLIVSSLIQLGSKTYDGQDTPVRNADGTATPGELNQNTWKVWSGLNGVYTQSAYGGGIAAWYGGAMLDRYYSGNTDANRAAKSLFRFDGSGYLAKKNIAWEADGSGYVANNKIAWDTSGNLTVDGYVLTNEVQLKDSNSNIKAGISGAYNASATGNGIASWWGGEKLEKSVWDSSSASYKAAHEYARSLFRMDGSGYLANNNISWDAAGNLDVNGFVLTNEIQLKDSNGNVKAGISGRYNSSSRGGGLATWYGGPKVDHIDSPSTTPYALTGFRFDGTGYLADGKIRWDYDQSTLKLVIDGYVLTNEIQLQDGSGNIQAGISGAYDSRTVEQGGARGHGIAAWYGGPKVDHLQYPSATDYASSLFRMDGSGYLAGGELQWGASGELIIHGTSAATPITIENAELKDGNTTLSIGDLILSINDLLELKSWFTVESWTDSSGTHNYLKLNASNTGLEGFVSDGFISAGGLSPGSGSGGADLPAVWTSLRNTTTTASEINNTIKINALHIPIGSGLGIDGNGQIYATNATSGTVTGVKRQGDANPYTPDSNGVVTIPAYPTSLPASDVSAWAKASTKPSYAFSEITGTATISQVSGLQTALDAKANSTALANYLPLTGGKTITGWVNFDTGTTSEVGITYDINRASSSLTGAWAYAPLIIRDVNDSTLFQIGVYGSSGALSYAYLGVNAYNGNNLRINSTGMSWGTNTIWHAGNDGASSGLDADLLDGQHGSYYAAASSLADYVKLNPGAVEQTIRSSISDISKGVINLWRHGNNYSFIGFSNGTTETYLGGLGFLSSSDHNAYRKTGTNYYKLWDENNDGSGSGLDADLLDGQHGSYYAPLSALDNYLPLTAGTSKPLTDSLYIITGDNDKCIQFSYNTSHLAGAAWRIISNGTGTSDTNYLSFQTGGSSSAATTWNNVLRLSMDNRYVGINKDAPAYNLDVNGSARVTTLRVGTTSNAVASYLEWDETNRAWKLTGNFYATGWVSAGGVSSGGGSGGIDSDAMWSLLANTDSTKKINVAHLPYSTGTGISISGTTISLASGVCTAGTYYKTTVDNYGRVTAGYYADLSAAINGDLGIGSSNPQDADYYIAQYAGGGTTTTSYHRRPHSALYSYINTKLAAAHAGLDKVGTVTKVSTGTGLTGGDITSTGTISINSTYQTYITNGNTAHGWGNHASAGYVKLNPGAAEQTIQSSISSFVKGVINLWRSSGDHYTFLGFSNGTTETYLGGIGFKSQSDHNLYRKDGSNYYKIWDENNLTKSVITNLIGTTTYAAYHAAGYVKKDSDTMTGSLTLKDANANATFVKNVALSSTSDWARSIVTLQVDGSNKFYIGACGNYTAGGSSNGISYAYIGVNGYDGTNLRFGSDSTLKWGTDVVLHAGNYTSYALPRSGGASYPMTGQLYVQTGTGISDASGNGLLVYHPASWTGVSNTQWAVGAVDCQGVIRSSATDLIHYKGGTNYVVLDASNYSSYALPLTGGKISGSIVFEETAYNPAVPFVRNMVDYSGGWERRLAAMQINGTDIIKIGAFGSGTSVTYSYIGVNGYTGVNLRFYPDSTLKFGDNTVWHAGNSNKPDVAWAASRLNVGYNVGQSTANRAEISCISKTDIPADIWLGANSAAYWSINCRDSSSNYDFSIYNSNLGHLFRIKGDTGNVGIGTGSPGSYKLYVNGGVYSPTAYYIGTGGANSYMASDAANNIYFHTSSGVPLVLDGLVVRRGASYSTATLGSSTYPWGGVYSTTGNFSGAVSCGAITSSGALNITGATSYSNGIRIHDFESISSVWFRAVNASGYDAGMWGITAADAGLRFRGPASKTATTPNDYVTIAHGGNIGIGTTSPSQKLHVGGNILATGAITAGAASDARLKTNISTLSDSDAKALIMALRPVSFTWNDKATELYDQYKGDDLGFVAQEVENVLPVAVGTIFEKYKRLDQTKFIAPLVAVAKDHETRIEKLEKEVKAKDAKIVELESEVKRLRMN